ncbi:hypothetical protein P3L10_000138 [Capsicum annuum]
MATKVHDYENLSERKKNQLLRDRPSRTNIKCDVPGCEKKFLNVESLKSHYQDRHDVPLVQENLCNECGNYFAYQGDKARHKAFYDHKY